MKIKFFKAIDGYSIPKVNIHKSGKLGFSKLAADRMKIQNAKFVYLGKNEDDPKDESLYLVVSDNIRENDISFKICKTGDYYYLKTKHIFDQAGVDYKSKLITYTVSEEIIDGNRMFKLSLKRKTEKQIQQL